MREIDIDEATVSLPELVSSLGSNEEIVLTKAGERVAKLVPLPKRQVVRLGRLEGLFQIPDDFDAPLPDDVLALFYESPLFPDEAPSDKPVTR